MMIITVMIVIVILMISTRHILVKYWREWEETSIDNIARMRDCACYRCRKMCTLYDEYAPYAQIRTFCD